MNAQMLLNAVQMLMSQGGANPQMVAQNILRNNPQFAQMIQGQNVQQLAIKAMQDRGINPAQVMGYFNGRR